MKQETNISTGHVSLGILVMTCDKYSDVWEAFYTLFQKYWPNCPYQVYNASETKVASYSLVQSIITHTQTEWCERLLFALEQIQEPYVLLLQEDFLLLKSVNTLRINELLQILHQEQGAYIRIVPYLGPSKTYKKYDDIGEISKNAPYSISAQATIWNKRVLQAFLRPQDNVWQYELEGSKRAFEITQPLLGVMMEKNHQGHDLANYAYTYFCTAVFRGKWMREAVIMCKKEGISLDLTYRPEEDWLDVFYRIYYNPAPMLFKHGIDFISHRIIRPLLKNAKK